MLPIKGLQKTSLIDFPPHTSCVIFIGGCNFRCPFCQNKDLVIDINKQKTMPEEEIFEFLNQRKAWIDAVVITGGEPTLYNELISFIEKVKSKGFLVKLDTNGTNPIILQELISNKLIDYIAMDIKSSIKKYNEVTKIDLNLDHIKKSVDMIKNSGIDYEFRTTVVPEFFTIDDAYSIGEWLTGCKKYVMQQFRTGMGTLDPEFENKNIYAKSDFLEFKKILSEHIDEIEIKGV